jgi:RNA polymerase sigma-54 factor
MQKLSANQSQQFKTIPIQIQANAILNMGSLELQEFIQTEAMENPALCLEESSRCGICGFLSSLTKCPVCGSAGSRGVEVKGSTERDYLEHSFAGLAAKVFDPFGTVASGKTLTDYLTEQASMVFGGRKLRIARYIIESLDESGYFRESMYETAELFAAAVPEIEAVLHKLQSLDPPGICARDLQECLLLQVEALDKSDPVVCAAERILAECWDDFSRRKIGAVVSRTKIDADLVADVAKLIREKLTPNPSSLYTEPFSELTPDTSGAVVPDVIFHRCGGSFAAEVVDTLGSVLKVDETYDELHHAAESGCRPVTAGDAKHVREYVERVRTILDAINLRKQTLARVATYLAECQKGFLEHGASGMKSLRQKDVAAALGVHESTICRAVSDKYCRLPSGELVSFQVFFDSAMPVRNLIKQIIETSPRSLTDNEIAQQLAQHGVDIARRTVAKYRDQIRALPYQLRIAA